MDGISYDERCIIIVTGRFYIALFSAPEQVIKNTLNWAVLLGRIKFTQISDYIVCIYTELKLLCLRF